MVYFLDGYDDGLGGHELGAEGLSSGSPLDRSFNSDVLEGISDDLRFCLTEAGLVQVGIWGPTVNLPFDDDGIASCLKAHKVRGRSPVKRTRMQEMLESGDAAVRERFGVTGKSQGLPRSEARHLQKARRAMLHGFNNLPPDPYVDEDRPIIRFREYGHFDLRADDTGLQLSLLPHGPFKARHSDKTNQYLSGKVDERLFKPLSPEIAMNSIVHHAIAAIFDRLPEYLQDQLKQKEMFASVMVQPFDVRSLPNGAPSEVTPEGKKLSEYKGFEHLSGSENDIAVHVDGHDIVVVMLVKKDECLEGDYVHLGIKGADGVGKHSKVRLDRPGDYYVVAESIPDEDGNRNHTTVMHGVTPIYSRNSKQVMRQVLLLNFNFYTREEKEELTRALQEGGLGRDALNQCVHAGYHSEIDRPSVGPWFY